MAEKPYRGLAALAVLQEKLSLTSTLEVIHSNGYLWEAHFKFEVPAKMEEIEEVEEQLQLPFPPAYKQFLLHYNGALLYYDDEYGQWGYQLYGTSSLFHENTRWKDYYEGKWLPSYLAFAKSVADVDLLLLDIGQPIDDGDDCRVIDGNSTDPPTRWRVAVRSFSDWLDRLVVAQGAKYWRWH